METVNIHKAKTHLSRLVDAAAKGQAFIIAKAGKPMVKVSAIENAGVDTSKRFGACADQMWVMPENFDRWAEDEIVEMFGVEE